LAVEPAAAALAATEAGPAEKVTIQKAIQRMIAAENGEDEPLDSDIAFHVAVLHASGNRFYAQLSELIESALRFSIKLTNRYKGVRLASVADHKKVSDAILAARPHEAAEAMRNLIQEALDLIKSEQAGTFDADIRARAQAR
jgi:DNA-binding FadR family transcriptional regulator